MDFNTCTLIIKLTIIINNAYFCCSSSPIAICHFDLNLETANAITNIFSYLSNHGKALLNLINVIINDKEWNLNKCSINIGRNFNDQIFITKVRNRRDIFSIMSQTFFDK